MASIRMTCMIILLITALIIPSMLIIPQAIRGEGDLLEVTPIDDPELPPWGFYKGILPNPESGGDIGTTYENVSSFTQMVPVWGRPTPFYNLSEDLSGVWGGLFVEQLIRGNGMFPLVHMSFFGQGMTVMTPPELPSATLNDPEWRSLYIQSAKDIVNASRPKYMSLGNEVNRWFETHGMGAGDDNGFQHFISLYNETYDAVKSISPGTNVFCTFSREMVSENREANLSILEHFDPDRMDMLAFTSYPFAVAGINRVSDMGSDYYSKAFLHFEEKPFGLTEVTWTADPAFGGEEEQSSFVKDLFSRFTDGLDTEFLSWNWLHDLAPADMTGLRDINSNERLALDTWINNTEPVYDPSNRTITLPEDFGTYVYDLNRTFSDPDELDILSYSVWNGTDYSNYTETKVKAELIDWSLHLTSIQDLTGVTQLNIKAEDWSGLTNWTIIQITLENVNDAPTENIGFPDPHRFAEGQSSYIDLSYYISDPDHPFILLSGEVLESPNMVASMDLSSSPYLVLYSQEDDWFGETHVLMNISDPLGAYLLANLSVIVTPVNDPPATSSPSSLEIEEDGEMTIDLLNWFRDPEEDTLSFQCNMLKPDNVHLILNGTTLSILPAPNFHGYAQLTINVSDGIYIISKTLSVHITPVNDDPILLNIGAIILNEDEEVYIPLSSFDPVDHDGDTLFWSISSISEELWSVSLPANDTIHIVPSADRFGPANFTLQVEDGRGGSTSSLVELEIEGINDAPLFIVPPNWTTEIAPGGHKEIDLSDEPYLVEDVDHDLSDLTVHSDYELISFDGLLVNISIPEDISSTELSIWMDIQDPEGSRSVERKLLIKVMEIGDHDIEVDNITVTSEDGIIKVRVEGIPYQSIWAVLTDEDGAIGSYLMTETTPGSGSYELNIEDLQREDGEVLEVHLSTNKNGENDSNLPASPVTFREGLDEGEETHTPSVIPYIAALVLITAIIMIYMIIRSRDRDKVSDFDYESLLEE